MRNVAAWALAGLAALALAAGVALVYAQRTVFDADGFADRAAATLESASVRAAVARRVSDGAIAADPDLVAVRPLIETTADAIMRSEAFQLLLRGAVRDLHRSAFDRDATTVTLSIADAGILLSDTLRRLSPDVARRVPDDVDTRLLAVTGGNEEAALRVAQHAQNVRLAAPIAFAAAALLALAALAAAPTRREALLRLGGAIAVAGGRRGGAG